MADKAEKDLDQASDCGWVRGLDANGNSIKMSKDEFVKSTEMYMSPIGTPYDANDITRNGSSTVTIGNVADYDKLYKNYPGGYGVIFHINGGYYFSAQIFFDPYGTVYMRAKNSIAWGEWKEISFT